MKICVYGAASSLIDESYINAGIELGFRQGIDYFYFEPFIRGGYPYLLGVGVSCGVRF